MSNKNNLELEDDVFEYDDGQIARDDEEDDEEVQVSMDRKIDDVDVVVAEEEHDEEDEQKSRKKKGGWELERIQTSPCLYTIAYIIVLFVILLLIVWGATNMYKNNSKILETQLPPVLPSQEGFNLIMLNVLGSLLTFWYYLRYPVANTALTCLLSSIVFTMSFFLNNYPTVDSYINGKNNDVVIRICQTGELADHCNAAKTTSYIAIALVWFQFLMIVIILMRAMGVRKLTRLGEFTKIKKWQLIFTVINVLFFTVGAFSTVALENDGALRWYGDHNIVQDCGFVLGLAVALTCFVLKKTAYEPFSCFVNLMAMLKFWSIFSWLEGHIPARNEPYTDDWYALTISFGVISVSLTILVFLSLKNLFSENYRKKEEEERRMLI